MDHKSLYILCGFVVTETLVALSVINLEIMRNLGVVYNVPGLGISRTKALTSDCILQSKLLIRA